MDLSEHGVVASVGRLRLCEHLGTGLVLVFEALQRSSWALRPVYLTRG